MTGIESRNENLALWVEFSPKSSAAVMVMPDLETPGISARAWKMPINMAVFIEISVFVADFLSAMYSNRPKIIVVEAMTNGLLKFASIKSAKAKPQSPTGIVPKPTPQAILLCPICFLRARDLKKSLKI